MVGNEVEEAGSYDADEGHDVLGSFDQCSANLEACSKQRNKGGREKTFATHCLGVK